MIEYIPIALIAFLFGSIPVAYLLVKRAHKMDLRNEGSRNIGTMNAYEVTGSKSIGKQVLMLDALKSLIPVLLAGALYTESFTAASVALVFVVLGHNYSPWIGFKGGRGLASGAGGALALNPAIPAIWGAAWYIVFTITKNIHWGNIVATIVMPIVVWLAAEYLVSLNVQPKGNAELLVRVTLAVSILIMIKHLEPLRDLLVARKEPELQEPEKHS